MFHFEDVKTSRRLTEAVNDDNREVVLVADVMDKQVGTIAQPNHFENTIGVESCVALATNC